MISGVLYCITKIKNFQIAEPPENVKKVLHENNRLKQ